MDLVTGATGLLGSYITDRLLEAGRKVRVFVRGGSDTHFLDSLPAEKFVGDLTDAESCKAACAGVQAVYHAAAKVGDWGPVDEYRAVNVRGLEHLLNAAEASGSLRRFIHISSLGVYEGRDHHGTDESVAPSTTGMDGYTLTKVEAEQLVLRHIRDKNLPGTILRPGFIYGPRDRTVLPRLLERLKAGQVKFFGTGEQLMNNTFVGNLVEIRLRFRRIHPIGNDQEVAEIIMHPMVAKGLVRMMEKSIKEWEKDHGEIHMPDDVGLLEQLFRAKFRPGEENESDQDSG